MSEILDPTNIDLIRQLQLAYDLGDTAVIEEIESAITDHTNKVERT
jgi:hypothetical protein